MTIRSNSPVLAATKLENTLLSLRKDDGFKENTRPFVIAIVVETLKNTEKGSLRTGTLGDLNAINQDMAHGISCHNLIRKNRVGSDYKLASEGDVPRMVDNIRILILEDRATDADLVEYELMQSGLAFTIKRTVTEKEFLQACEEFCPDLILSDYDLPQYNGALALAEAKRRLPDVPFILVTGALDKGEEQFSKILAGGATDVVLKSSLDRLVPAVHDALRSKERA